MIKEFLVIWCLSVFFWKMVCRISNIFSDGKTICKHTRIWMTRESTAENVDVEECINELTCKAVTNKGLF